MKRRALPLHQFHVEKVSTPFITPMTNTRWLFDRHPAEGLMYA